MNSDLALLMEENLIQVWSENNSSNRIKAIEKIYTSDSNLYHVGHQTTGHEAINESVNNILANMHAAFTFFKLKPVVINNNMGRLIWGMGPNIESLVATGMDIAVFEDGKIKSLYVFLD
ncbi:nuclear transport factor 2 family protein [Olivibacter sp. SDN3]|uniref:nuclear transport factor 2 family protein n=1 Tax=Olivibacter sp. SDN3 TaxID=2764720 RepID=UPI001651095C|nr:nuclear transport factor 2 family protein [Olivibacter sp. SDN3]QNL48833.1 nuclear transport factor 2 family protein [Olivibacter sp. SDN3]